MTEKELKKAIGTDLAEASELIEKTLELARDANQKISQLYELNTEKYKGICRVGSRPFITNTAKLKYQLGLFREILCGEY